MLNGAVFMDRAEIKLRGIHNVENVMAASLIAYLAGAPLDRLAEAVATFPGVEHRIEFVRKLDGVSYFNDSKATNVDAALKAVDSFDGQLWIILGGKDKGAGYGPLVLPLQQKAKAALLIGAATPLIRDAFDGRVPYVDCGTVQNAVEYARAHAEAGDTVLLAPACASFDQFESYEHRGRIFKHLVQNLF
jgi:UDP-N-acetylmuramoylalanine--D-glutamate ligase